MDWACGRASVYEENHYYYTDEPVAVLNSACERRCPYELPIRQMLTRCKQEFGA